LQRNDGLEGPAVAVAVVLAFLVVIPESGLLLPLPLFLLVILSEAKNPRIFSMQPQI
jgi:hypothetical protein